MPLINCPHCQQKIDAPEEALGKEVECPGCEKPFVPPVGNLAKDYVQGIKAAVKSVAQDNADQKAERELAKKALQQDQSIKRRRFDLAVHASPLKRPRSYWVLLTLTLAFIGALFGAPATNGVTLASIPMLIFCFWLVDTFDSIRDSQLDSNDLQLRIIELLEKQDKKPESA